MVGQGALAQEMIWQPTGGPNGSEGRAVEVSPDDVLYVGTFGDGVYRSRDQGRTWEFFGLDGVHAVYDFAFSAESVFAATWNGIYRTSPESSEWELTVNGQAFSVAVGPEGMIFAGFLDGSVLRSEDGGNSWADYSEGLGGSGVEPNALEIDDDGRVFVGTAAGLYLLEDDLPWRRISSDSLRVSSVALIGRDSILIGTHGQTTSGVLRSDDGGATWTAINGNLDRPLHVSALITFGGNVIITATSSGVYRSSDGGSSWMKSDVGLVEDGVYDIAADRTGALYAGTIIGGGIYRSRSAAVSWEHIGLPATRVVSLAFGLNGEVYAAPTNGSVSVLTSASGEWNVLGQYDIGALAVGSNGELLAASLHWPSLNLIWKDDGAGWREVAAPSDCSSVQSFHMTSHGLYAAAVPIYPPVGDGSGSTATPCGGVFHSDNFSLSWSHLGFDGAYVFDVLRTSRGNLLAASEEGIFVSGDDGETWERAEIPSDGRQRTALTEDPEGRLFAGTTAGVLRSSDGGTTWSAASLEDIATHDILVSPAGDILAATDDGVFTSSDTARTWTQLEAGLPVGPVLELGLNSENYLFASVENRGVHRSIESIPSAIGEPKSGSQPSSIDAFPNPSAGSIAFSISLPEARRLRIEIFDILGRAVAVPLDDQVIPAGSHEVVWSPDVHASGLYMYKVSGQGEATTGTIVLTK